MYTWYLKKKYNNKKVDLNYVSKRTPVWKPLLFLAPGLILIIIFTFIPFFLALKDAFKVELNPNKRGGDWKFGFDHLQYVLSKKDFARAFSNSILYAFLQIPLSICISILIAIAVSKIINKTFRGFTQTLFFMPYVTSGVAVALAFAYIFSGSNGQNGLFNQIFGLNKFWLKDMNDKSYAAFFVMLVNGVWGALAFQVLIFTTALLSVDKERYKAASIDGASPVKQFFAITLPSISGTMNFIITIGLINAIKVFPLALFQNNPQDALDYGGGTLMIYIFNFTRSGEYSIAAAASVILVVISITFSIAVKNSMRGAVMLVKWRGEQYVAKKIKKHRQD